MSGCLNENIKRLRLQYGINQVVLAKKLNVTKQCVSNWENDNVLPSIEALERLADFFCVSTDNLLGRTVENTINVEGLTEEQIAHIRILVADLRKANSDFCEENQQESAAQGGRVSSLADFL